MGKKSEKKAKADRINALRKQYDAFLEEDKKRKERNEYILGKLDKIRYGPTAIQIRHKPIGYGELYPAYSRLPYRPDHQAFHIDLSPEPIRDQSLQAEIPSTFLNDPSLLKELTKKYILIPKLRSSLHDYVETVSHRSLPPVNQNYGQPQEKTNVINNDDWKSKYDILEQLKVNEKEEQTKKYANDDSVPVKEDSTIIKSYPKEHSEDYLLKSYNSEEIGKKYEQEIPEKDLDLENIVVKTELGLEKAIASKMRIEESSNKLEARNESTNQTCEPNIPYLSPQPQDLEYNNTKEENITATQNINTTSFTNGNAPVSVTNIKNRTQDLTNTAHQLESNLAKNLPQQVYSPQEEYAQQEQQEEYAQQKQQEEYEQQQYYEQQEQTQQQEEYPQQHEYSVQQEYAQPQEYSEPEYPKNQEYAPQQEYYGQQEYHQQQEYAQQDGYPQQGAEYDAPIESEKIYPDPNSVYLDKDDYSPIEVVNPSQLVEKIQNDQIVNEIINDENEYPAELLSAQDFTPNEGVKLENGVNINPSYLATADNKGLASENDPQSETEIKQKEAPPEISGIEDFNTEQRELFYSEEVDAHTFDQQAAGDVYNQDYAQNEIYTENQGNVAYYEGANELMEQAYPVEVNEYEETSSRYDQNYEQQYTNQYEEHAYQQQEDTYEQPAHEQIEESEQQYEEYQYQQPDNETVDNIERVLDNEQGISETQMKEVKGDKSSVDQIQKTAEQKA